MWYLIGPSEVRVLPMRRFSVANVVATEFIVFFSPFFLRLITFLRLKLDLGS